MASFFLLRSSFYRTTSTVASSEAPADYPTNRQHSGETMEHLECICALCAVWIKTLTFLLSLKKQIFSCIPVRPIGMAFKKFVSIFLKVIDENHYWMSHFYKICNQQGSTEQTIHPHSMGMSPLIVQIQTLTQFLWNDTSAIRLWWHFRSYLCKYTSRVYFGNPPWLKFPQVWNNKSHIKITMSCYPPTHPLSTYTQTFFWQYLLLYPK